jgi:hypothetical protein
MRLSGFLLARRVTSGQSAEKRKIELRVISVIFTSSRKHRFDVVVVPFDAISERRLIAQTVYLSPANHAGLHPEPLAVAIDVPLEDSSEARELGPRTEEAHLSPDDIDELLPAQLAS